MAVENVDFRTVKQIIGDTFSTRISMVGASQVTSVNEFPPISQKPRIQPHSFAQILSSDRRIWSYTKSKNTTQFCYLIYVRRRFGDVGEH